MLDPTAEAYELARRYITRVQETGATALSLTPNAVFSIANEDFPADERFRSLVALPPEIDELTSLESLVLVDAPVTDVAALAGLTSLKELFLGGAPVTDIVALAGLTSLKTLGLSDTRVRDLGPLAGLTGLKTLDVSDTDVSDLAPLAELTALAALMLNRTQVADLSPIAGLHALERIELQNTPVTDVAPLAELTTLRLLAMSGTPVADLTPLARLDGLRKIWLSGTAATANDPTLAELARSSDDAEGAKRTLAYLRGENVDVPSGGSTARRNGKTGSPADSSGADWKRRAVQALQQELTKIGLDPGPADGIGGPGTKAALAQVEFPEAPDIERMVSRRFPDLTASAIHDISELLHGETGSPTLSLKDDDRPAGSDPIDAHVNELQRHLIEQEALEGTADGILGAQTREAIHAFADRQGVFRDLPADAAPREFAQFPALARRLAPGLSDGAVELLAGELFRDGVQRAWSSSRPLGDALIELQTLLLGEGRTEGPVDGVLDPSTRVGLTELADGLRPDDGADPPGDRDALRRALAGRYPDLSDEALDLWVPLIWRPPRDTVEVETAPFYSDQPALVDELGREAVARTIATMVRTVQREPLPDTAQDRSFMVHLYGPWGAGKTSILNFLRDVLLSGRDEDAEDGGERLRVAPDPGWIIVDYNAWRNQSLGPPWWTLMNAVYRDAREQLAGRDGRTRRRIRYRQLRWEFLTGWVPALSGVLLLLVAIGIMLFVSPDALGLGEDWGVVAKTLSSLIPLVGSVFLLKGEIGLFNSHAARRFIELSRDPVGPLTRRYEELIEELDRPVAVFVDDLDRCDSAFVVELLQSIQTLFRGARVFYVVAADRDWVCTAYETVYGDFAPVVSEPGKSLGHLFLEKVFQLSVEVPGLGVAQRDLFWRSLIERGRSEGAAAPEGADREEADGGDRSGAAALPDASSGESGEEPVAGADEDIAREIEAEVNRQTTERGVIDVVRQHSDDVRHARIAGAKAFERMQSRTLRRSQEHLLWRYREMLDPNPRAMKRLLNAYGFRRGFEIWNYGTGRALDLRAGKLPRDDTAIYDRDRIVRETILATRWPILADYLDPHSTRTFEPRTINTLIGDPEVRGVVSALGNERFEPIAVDSRSG